MFKEIDATPLTEIFLVLLVVMILLAPLAGNSVLKTVPQSNCTHQGSE